MTHATTIEAKGDRELVVTRLFDAPPALVWRAWTTAGLMQQWWIPKSIPMTLKSIDIDARVGGGYRLVFDHPQAGELAFFGKYLEVDAPHRLAWSNDESPDGAVTTVTLEAQGAQTLLTLHELYPTKAARDEGLNGGAAGLPEQFSQLDVLLPTL